MGEVDVDPTPEIRVWYGLHDWDGCGTGLMQMEAFFLAEHVRKQNALPRRDPSTLVTTDSHL